MTDALPSGLHPETLAVLAGRPAPIPDGPVNEPIALSATYHAGGPVAYGRDGNATWTACEAAIGALEGGEVLLFASGMAASAAVVEQLPPGAVIVVAETTYFGVRSLLEDRARIGRVVLRIADITDVEATRQACVGASLLWLESPTNPLLDIADLATLAEGAHRHGAIALVDNTLATPLLQQPLDLGVDLVMHSATKYLSGHSDVLAGALVTRNAELHRALFRQREMYGGVLGPVEAYLLLRGIRTLPVRLRQAQATAQTLAQRLDQHGAVTRVRYPGLPTHAGYKLAQRQMRGPGAMLAFEIAGTADDADQFCANLRIITHATSLGGVESLIERRNRWPGEERTPPTLLRLSVGCEHVEDLWSDLEQALSQVPDRAPRTGSTSGEDR